MGLLDMIADPVAMAKFTKERSERRGAIERVAAWACSTPEAAQFWLDEQDRNAMEWFEPGNDIPRHVLH